MSSLETRVKRLEVVEQSGNSPVDIIILTGVPRDPDNVAIWKQGETTFRVMTCEEVKEHV